LTALFISSPASPRLLNRVAGVICPGCVDELAGFTLAVIGGFAYGSLFHAGRQYMTLVKPFEPGLLPSARLWPGRQMHPMMVASVFAVLA
jgi:hypothetical protein